LRHSIAVLVALGFHRRTLYTKRKASGSYNSADPSPQEANPYTAGWSDVTVSYSWRHYRRSMKSKNSNYTSESHARWPRVELYGNAELIGYENRISYSSGQPVKPCSRSHLVSLASIQT